MVLSETVPQTLYKCNKLPWYLSAHSKQKPAILHFRPVSTHALKSKASANHHNCSIQSNFGILLHHKCGFHGVCKTHWPICARMLWYMLHSGVEYNGYALLTTFIPLQLSQLRAGQRCTARKSIFFDIALAKKLLFGWTGSGFVVLCCYIANCVGVSHPWRMPLGSMPRCSRGKVP